MELVYAGLSCDLGNVFFIYSATGKDRETSVGSAVKFFEKRDTVIGCGSLPRGEDPVATECDDIFQGAEGVATVVKGTMEGNAHALSRFHEEFTTISVDIAIGCKASEHNTIGTELTGYGNILGHALQLKWRIKEVAATRTDNDMETRGRQYPPCCLYLSV